jgi:Tol biopolymer transport system component/flagellar motor protein MotB
MQNGQLMTVRPNGTELGVLWGHRNQSVWFPAASPDGSYFLAWISKGDSTQNVARIDVKTGAVQYLTSIYTKARPEMKNTRLGNAPACNPAGTKIAYAFNGDIWVMDSDGYNAVTVISDHCSWSPDWSADGKKLAYVNGRDGNFQLWVTDVEDRDSYQVTDFEDFSVGHPRWNSNGKNILFTKSQKDTCALAQVLAVGISEPLVDSNPITKDEHSQGGEFSPDGLKIIYSYSKDGGDWDLWTCSASGADTMPITKKCLAFAPTWLHPTGSAAASVASTPVMPKAPALPPSPDASSPAAAKPESPKAVETPKPDVAPAAQAQAPQAPAPAAPQAEKPAAPQGVPSRGSRPPERVPAAAAGPANAAPVVPEKPVPTQPPVKMAPLKFHIAVSFDSGAKITSGLPNIKTVAARIKQYRDGEIHVRGPLDTRPAGGKFSSAMERSRARAESVRKVLAKESGIPESKMSASPYAPPVLGAQAGASNSLQIYIDLK